MIHFVLSDEKPKFYIKATASPSTIPFYINNVSRINIKNSCSLGGKVLLVILKSCNQTNVYRQQRRNAWFKQSSPKQNLAYRFGIFDEIVK